jgi:hypothetical protein
MAYAEMGLREDAVRELRLAVKSMHPGDPRFSQVQGKLEVLAETRESGKPPPVLH